MVNILSAAPLGTTDQMSPPRAAVPSAREVDDVVVRAATAGATVTRDPSDTFYGGYAGCFRYPDGHVWEVAFNPGVALDDEGNLTVPTLGDPE